MNCLIGFVDPAIMQFIVYLPLYRFVNLWWCVGFRKYFLRDQELVGRGISLQKVHGRTTEGLTFSLL